MTPYDQDLDPDQYPAAVAIGKLLAGLILTAATVITCLVLWVVVNALASWAF